MGKAGKAIDGFVAWCMEFVYEVRDVRGTRMPMEWGEQLEFLRNAAVDEVVNIPDISDDETLVKVIDELKYRIKGGRYGANGRSLTEDFDTMLNVFICDNNLGSDQHSFASLPSSPLVGSIEAETVIIVDGDIDKLEF
jgi:hypothetical protein